MREVPSCYDKALALLAQRAHFERELQRKLVKRGYESGEVEAAVVKLRRNGFLDDARTALTFVRERLRRGPIGRRRMIADLVRRGAAREAIDLAIEELPEDDTEPTRIVAERWLARSNRPEGPKRKAALARHLGGKGFSQRAIVTVLESVADALPDGDP